MASDSSRSAPQRRRIEKLAEVIAREIVHDIKGLPPSTKLPSEAAMLQRYDVGRASLREALRLLEVQGLIVIKVGPGGGPVVSTIESENFARMTSLYLFLLGSTYRDVFEARIVIEPMMARLAAERADSKDLEALTAFVDPVAVVHEDDIAYAEAASSFHGLLSGLSGNPVLDFMGRALKDIYTNRLAGVVVPFDERHHVENEHSAIARAIITGKSDEAERLMQEHMVKFAKYADDRNPGVLDEVIDWR